MIAHCQSLCLDMEEVSVLSAFRAIPHMNQALIHYAGLIMYRHFVVICFSFPIASPVQI